MSNVSKEATLQTLRIQQSVGDWAQKWRVPGSRQIKKEDVLVVE